MVNNLSLSPSPIVSFLSKNKVKTPKQSATPFCGMNKPPKDSVSFTSVYWDSTKKLNNLGLETLVNKGTLEFNKFIKIKYLL